jgi:hypothetical protein
MKKGDLRVWWIPQVPGKAFNVDVASVAEGVKVMDTLADYDLFQLKNRIKPDYCNAGGLNVYVGPDSESDDGWESWEDPETGEDDPREFLRATA